MSSIVRISRLILTLGLFLSLLACPSTPKPAENTVATPTFSPEGGSFDKVQTVEIKTATEGAEIRFTLDGADPSATAGVQYTGPVKIEKSATLAAVAYKKDMLDSSVAKAGYEIKISVAPPAAGVEPVSDEEIMAVRNAIARAKEADADYYDAENLKEANRLLEEALSARASDPAKARENLASAKQKADLAYENSVERAAADLSARMDALKQTLLDQQADKFLPDEYESAVSGIDEAKALFENGEFSDGRAKAFETLKAMTDLSSKLENRLSWIRILKRDTEQFLQEAEAADANQWAPEAKDKANSLYLQGMEAFQGYKLDEAEESYGAAREAAKDALAEARANKAAAMAGLKEKTEALRMKTMNALQDASGLTVVTEDGTVIEPRKWSGEDALKELEKLEKEREKQKEENQAEGQSLLIPSGRETAVLAGESMENLLTQAKELWKLGLQEEAKGNYAKAQEYYQESLRYVEVYKSYAVKGVYTVRLLPEKRDCLWRISEYDFVYGNPRLWPKIWRRNRRLIQNPDLIYPGWQLVIPPE